MEPAAQSEDVPLVFITPLQNREALPGETTGFFCELSHVGVEPIWLKDNQPLSMADDKYQIINEDKLYCLVIPSVTTDDAGQYSVQVGDLQSTGLLTVQGK